jgi:integrase
MRNKIYVVPMVLRLLIGCGFRISETLALKVENYDEDKQVLHMYETKNCKARDIPLSSSLAEILEMYIARLRHQNPEAIYLFPGNTGHPHYNIKQFAYDFSKLKSLSGITAETAEHSRGACVHTLRHYFAITSFKKNIDMIESAESAVPYLSYYLGHEDYRETEKYLKFTGSLFPEMIEAFGSYSNELFEDNTYDEEE